MNDITHRDQWSPGETATFEYSLPFDANSAISHRLHHRSGQQVVVVEEADADNNRAEFPTIQERADAGALLCYTIQFPDGHEDTAFEDELHSVNGATR